MISPIVNRYNLAFDPSGEDMILISTEDQSINLYHSQAFRSLYDHQKCSKAWNDWDSHSAKPVSSRYSHQCHSPARKDGSYSGNFAVAIGGGFRSKRDVQDAVNELESTAEGVRIWWFYRNYSGSW